MPIEQEELDQIGLVLIDHTINNAEHIITVQNPDNQIRAIYYKFHVGLELALKVICSIDGTKNFDVESAYWLSEEEYKDEVEGLVE